ncbi:hypothetical protein FACS1894184_08990 [Clostridia bacterium]|nr:hypothetical protein FACS1894184_08990 [Clostridia bacterium]
MARNPIIWMDYPDIDVIRVDDTYYMISTTMHFMPGGVILRSYDLVHWEICSYVYDILEDTPGQRLDDSKGVYGKGMWAASLRFHDGRFYVCFVANDTRRTYLYQSDSITGPWTRQYIEGFYHDNSILFDDGRIYIVYGNTTISIVELNDGLTAPKPGGLDKVILEDDRGRYKLGYEGAHIYKINGYYYIFLIHWLKNESGRRVEACFRAKTLDSEWRGGDVLNADLGFMNAGVAQGGIVDTLDGGWYAMLFQALFVGGTKGAPLFDSPAGWAAPVVCVTLAEQPIYDELAPLLTHIYELKRQVERQMYALDQQRNEFTNTTDHMDEGF